MICPIQTLELRQSADLSFSAYSVEFDECYHSLREGALKESLQKHIQPAFAKILQNLRAQGALQNISQNALQSGALAGGIFENSAFGALKAPVCEAQAHIAILDICFGLGYNSFATLLYYATYAPKIRLWIYSPEKDCQLLDSLSSFPYPSEFSALSLSEILYALTNYGIYEGKNANIELYKGDALEYVKTLRNESFDIIYQDAFSPRKNPALWSEEYFMQCFRILKPNGILTTYSQSAQIRQNGINCGFFAYDFKPKICEGAKIRGGTLLLKEPLLELENYVLKSIAKREI
ncbi:tRNA (5-methylaminomethyl-2-thiouridine)(34)-methyltransferase MnmD [Helicobacter himalayensis]|uniref:tRNA (5-methylaminomethyl-2-thiouridine)(34)-methyltransferase MnmD n=1 Tax=Helicobacter himalayensis TaxID=1591088 RepID=UPI003D6FC1CC